jgi:hypothetical protein
MKMISSLLLMLFTYSTFAESIHCSDNKKKWTVDFELLGSSINKIVFKKDNQEIMKFDHLDGYVTNILGVRFYEFELGGAKYFDFETYPKLTEFSGEFLPTSNPFSLAVSVDCHILENKSIQKN